MSQINLFSIFSLVILLSGCGDKELSIDNPGDDSVASNEGYKTISDQYLSGKTSTIVKRVPDDFTLLVKNATPSALKPDTTTAVKFIVLAESLDKTSPLDIVLGGDVTATLEDLGTDGDLVAGDGFFMGTAMVDTSGLVPGHCLSVFTTGTRGDLEVVSDVHELCVSSFSIEQAVLTDLTNTVTDPQSGLEMIADEILIKIEKGTSEITINQIVEGIGGSVAEWDPELDVLVVKLQQSVVNSDLLLKIVADLKGLPEVIWAEPNARIKFD